MSNRHYPRYDSRRSLKPNTTLVCMAKSCTKQARHRVFVQVSYMRGDDDDYVVCDEHRKFPSGPEYLDDWLKMIEIRPVSAKEGTT